MTLKRYEVLRTIIETGSFLKAANELKLTQSGVSHAVSSLESELEINLLIRGHSGIKLTHNGEELLPYIYKTLNSYNQVLQKTAEIKEVKTGVVRVGTFPSVSVNWIPKVVKEFKQIYPDIEFKLFEGDYNDIISWIKNGVVDFGFLSANTKSELDIVHLQQDRILCILSDKHPLSNEKKLTFEQLKKETLIMPKTNIDKDIRNILRKNNISSNIKYEMEEDQAIIAMVQNNLGISVLPELILYRMPRDIRIANLETEYHRTIGMAALSFEKMALAAKTFSEFIYEWVTKSKH